MKNLSTMFAIIALGLPACSDGQVSTEQLNVVLVSIDSVRRDHLGIYGRRPHYATDVAISPNIDYLAQQGFVFDDAFSTTSWTLPAHMSLMTGRSDLAHGVLTDRFHRDPAHETLAQAFSALGYQTAGYYSGPYLADKYGFADGFDDYRSAMISHEDFLAMVVDENAKLKSLGREPMDKQMVTQLRDRMSHWDITSPKLNNLANEFLDNNNGDPFFLFVHYFDAHYDHLAKSVDPQLAKDFDPSYTGEFDGSNWYFDSRVMDTRPPFTRNISDRDLEHVIAFYDVEINWVDRHIGELINKLKDNGQWENTIIMVVADHGDEFFEHNSIGHRSTLFAEQVRIPMVLRVPNDNRAGARINNVSRIYDVAPTLLDLASNARLRNAEGESLRGDLTGEAIDRSAFQNIFSGGHRRSHKLNISDGWRNSKFSVVRSFRYNQQNSTAEEIAVSLQMQRASNSPYLVFDRINDPGETTPLTKTDPRFKSALEQFSMASKRQRKYLDDVTHSAVADCLIDTLSAEEDQILSQLGYSTAISEDENGFDIMALRLKNLPAAED
jgi:arylsulfatase A-like enzyme